jgi:1,4-alpha-glucan branching enzyme
MALKKVKKSFSTGKKYMAPKSSGKAAKAKKVTFSIHAPQANEVLIAGDFNNWEPKTRLKKSKATWQKDITLKPGKYEYKFVVDGNWVNDPANDCCAWNSFGTQNSVIEV